MERNYRFIEEKQLIMKFDQSNLFTKLPHSETHPRFIIYQRIKRVEDQQLMVPRRLYYGGATDTMVPHQVLQMSVIVVRNYKKNIIRGATKLD